MLRVLDLFAGIGGFSLGLERAGMTAVGFCEIDATCRGVLRHHWPTAQIFGDIRTLTTRRLELAGLKNIDLICGGFPCQDVSLAGKGAGLAGERSVVWGEFARVIGEVRPEWVIVENVAALRARGLAAVLQDLWQIGYDAEWHIISAAALGAPHVRERCWIVAYPHRPERRPDDSRRVRVAGQDDGLPEWPQDPGCPAERGETFPETRLRLTLGQCGPWPAEPQLGRVVDGLSDRMERRRRRRLKQLGNAVVPQIPELIGRAILDAIAREEAVDARIGASSKVA